MLSAMYRVGITVSMMAARYGDCSLRGERHRCAKLPNASSMWLLGNSQIIGPSLRHPRIRQPVRRYPVVALRQRLKEFTLRGPQTLNDPSVDGYAPPARTRPDPWWRFGICERPEQRPSKAEVRACFIDAPPAMPANGTHTKKPGELPARSSATMTTRN